MFLGFWLNKFILECDNTKIANRYLRIIVIPESGIN